MAVIMDLKFDNTGCLNTNVTNMGGMRFIENTPILGNTINKCATFQAFNKLAGLKVNSAAAPSVTSLINNSSKPFTMYFRYKIKKELMSNDASTPIISYRNKPSDYDLVPFIEICKKKYFSLHDKTYIYDSPDISFTFDGKWHTFTLERRVKSGTDYYYCYFIDGCQRTFPNRFSRTIKDNCNLSFPFFIGYLIDSYNNVYTFNGGSIDNFIITDNVVYEESFIPPTMYFEGTDVESNYYLNIIGNRSHSINRTEPDTIYEVERVIQHSLYHFNEAQKDYLPRRIPIEWWQETGYFKEEFYNRTIKHDRPKTMLDIRLFEHSMWFHHKRFLKGNAFKMLMNDEIQAFMLFVDKKFIPLSKINFIKSDDYLTVFIDDRDTDNNDWVKSVEIVTIPFPIIYEEDPYERPDLEPLYMFNYDGIFGEDGAVYYYYLNKKRTPNINSIPLREQNFPGIERDDGSDTGNIDGPDKYVKHVWRYGLFNTAGVVGPNAVIDFIPTDGLGPIDIGDEVVLYRNSANLEPERYAVCGPNQVKFYDYTYQNLPNNIVTLDVLTDSYFSLIEDCVDMKVVQVPATVNNQSTFDIPAVNDPGKPLPYRKFLLFKGSVSLENANRYEIDYDNNTVTLTNKEDYLRKDRCLVFVFVKTNKLDHYGELHVKPIFIYKTSDNNTDMQSFDIPYYRGVKYNKRNTLVFVNDTFITPYRYEIIDNKLKLTTPGDMIPPGQSFTFVLLRLVNDIEDPLTPRDKMISNQVRKGKRFVLYDLNIDKKYKITLDNLVCFDQHGRYIPDLFGRIYNMNIIKELHTSEPMQRSVRYVTCVYYTDSLENYSNTVLPNNSTFIKEYIRCLREFYEMDTHFDDFIKDFNIYHKDSKHYGVNLANALNYIVLYNQNLLDRTYERNSTCTRRTYSGKDLNMILKSRSDGKYDMSMYADTDYKYHKHHTHVIFFVNGSLAPWNNTIVYHKNEFKAIVPSLFNVNDVIESIHFHKTHLPFYSKLTIPST